MRPGAATEYLTDVADQFEQFASENFPATISDPHAEDARLLAGLRFVQTRRVRSHQIALREAFTTKRTGRHARENDRACLDALIDCTTNAVRTARFLAAVGSRRRPLPTTELCREGLKELGAPAVGVLLDELASNDDGICRRKLALLLARVSATRMPEPLRFWHRAEKAERDEVIERWRATLADRGKLPAD